MLRLLENLYYLIKQKVEEYFCNTTLQIWYPDKKTDDFLYKTNAGYYSGNSFAPFEFAPTFEEMKKRIMNVHINTIKFDELSCVSEGFYPFIYISNRHFRTPYLPQIWMSILNPIKAKTDKKNEA